MILPLASTADQLLPCWLFFLSRNWDSTSKRPVGCVCGGLERSGGWGEQC